MNNPQQTGADVATFQIRQWTGTKVLDTDEWHKGETSTSLQVVTPDNTEVFARMIADGDFTDPDDLAKPFIANASVTTDGHTAKLSCMTMDGKQVRITVSASGVTITESTVEVETDSTGITWGA
tara:strand:- start:653 stop:1024 length:372 start_codon:yes stop_codon:yes gene_type:complete